MADREHRPLAPSRCRIGSAEPGEIEAHLRLLPLEILAAAAQWSALIAIAIGTLAWRLTPADESEPVAGADGGLHWRSRHRANAAGEWITHTRGQSSMKPALDVPAPGRRSAQLGGRAGLGGDHRAHRALAVTRSSAFSSRRPSSGAPSGSARRRSTCSSRELRGTSWSATWPIGAGEGARRRCGARLAYLDHHQRAGGAELPHRVTCVGPGCAAHDQILTDAKAVLKDRFAIAHNHHPVRERP